MKIHNQCLNPISVPSVTGTTLRVLRCGHCVNCIRQKKNELAVRAYREFTGQSIAFLTFTYDDEHCPIQVTDIYTDGNGEFTTKTCVIRDKVFFDNAPFVWKRNKDGKASKRFSPYIHDTCFGMQVRYMTTYYDDLKLAIKRFRIKHPDTLHQFIAVPEYGSLTYRPHYHMLALGLSDDDISDLVSEWTFGHVDVDNGRNPNKANDPIRISQYIAKYCVKGKFDCPHISQGYCKKPRRSVSKNFGLGTDWDHLKSILYCTRELGITDPFKDVQFTERQLSLLASRRKFVVNDFNYVLPKYLVNKAFKQSIKTLTYDDPVTKRKYSCQFKVPLSQSDRCRYKKLTEGLKYFKTSYETHYHLVSSPLQTKVARYVLRGIVADALSKREELQRSFKTSSDVVKYYRSCEIIEQRINKKYEEDYISQLEMNSIF